MFTLTRCETGMKEKNPKQKFQYDRSSLIKPLQEKTKIRDSKKQGTYWSYWEPLYRVGTTKENIFLNFHAQMKGRARKDPTESTDCV